MSKDEGDEAAADEVDEDDDSPPGRTYLVLNKRVLLLERGAEEYAEDVERNVKLR
jgi:hypothetical protein